jgi:hypothetical protein
VKLDWQFLRTVAVTLAIAIALAAYPLSQFATPEILRSVVAGALMSIGNLLGGYIAIEISFGKSHTTFLKYVFGGMVVRLVLMWAIFLILLRFFMYHSASLMLTLMYFYVINLVLEIFYLQKRVQSKQ